ncbi:MAG TPA: hypothetical protein VGV61_13275, partial [Thermoanaerobaculia bacterium]|nr:hypothetical protein [Thermoanaerobaculia bacterium]
MSNRRRLVPRLGQPVALALALAALAIPCRAAGDDNAQAFRLAGPASTKAAKPAAVAPSQRLHVDVTRMPVLALGRVDRELLAAEDAINDRKPAKVIRFGLGRDVVVGAADGAWTELANGARLWVSEVMSPEAMGLRLHFADVNLPDGAELTVYAADLGDANPAFNPPEVHHGSAAAKAIGSSFWTGSIPGERARVEYVAPAGSEDGLPFRVDRLQHLYR